MTLELDLPGRTTRDYRGPPLPSRVQAALEAALTSQEGAISVSGAPSAVSASRAQQPARSAGQGGEQGRRVGRDLFSCGDECQLSERNVPEQEDTV